jgi:hypothetical protein
MAGLFSHGLQGLLRIGILKPVKTSVLSVAGF